MKTRKLLVASLLIVATLMCGCNTKDAVVERKGKYEVGISTFEDFSYLMFT